MLTDVADGGLGHIEFDDAADGDAISVRSRCPTPLATISVAATATPWRNERRMPAARRVQPHVSPVVMCC